MAVTPNRIVLISHGRHDEGMADADVYPGMVLTKKSNGNFVPNNVPGSGGPLLIATEGALRGLDATQKWPSGENFSFYRPTKGDLFLCLLQNLQNIANQTPLQSAGDGTLVAATSQLLNNIVAPSTVITNTGTETVFSNGTFTFPANYFQPGDTIKVHAKAFLVAVNSTNTHRIRLYFGATPVTIADSTALALVANDVVIIDATLTIRTITAAGTFIADGEVASSVAGTFTVTPFTVASSAFDSTVANALVIKSLASAASAGNQIRLDEFSVNTNRSGGFNPLVIADEAINNSAGAGSNPVSMFNTAAFIRCIVP